MMPLNDQASDMASPSASAMLASLHVNPEKGLTRAEVDIRRNEHGYNEVTEKKSHPVRLFLSKFWAYQHGCSN